GAELGVDDHGPEHLEQADDLGRALGGGRAARALHQLGDLPPHRLLRLAEPLRGLVPGTAGGGAGASLVARYRTGPFPCVGLALALGAAADAPGVLRAAFLRAAFLRAAFLRAALLRARLVRVSLPRALLGGVRRWSLARARTSRLDRERVRRRLGELGSRRVRPLDDKVACVGDATHGRRGLPALDPVC